MHDIDRTQLEGAMEFENFESEQFEFPGELQEVFNEAEQMELATELLEVRDEQELNYFLGNLIQKASGRVGGDVKPSLGQQLGVILKGAAMKAARQAVPLIGGAVGQKIGGRFGPAVGKGLTTFGTSALDAIDTPPIREYGEFNQEDREFEGAKQFVQLAANTVKNATAAPPGANPRAVARSAIVKAAQTVAPGLLQPTGFAAGGATYAPQAFGTGQSGVWFRRGNTIVLRNA